MTELEINKAVAEKLGIDDDYGTFTPLLKYAFDPCNNVEQAWEIMIKYNISVTTDYCGFYYALKLDKVGSYEFLGASQFYDEKPLVAAMLCFLEL